MIFHRLPTLILTLHFCVAAFAQSINIISVSFAPVFENQDLQTGNHWYKMDSGDSVQIYMLKFYVSDVELLNNDKSVWKEKNSFHLINSEDSNTANFVLNIPPKLACDKMKFHLGIDSTTNVSGAMGGVLDPTLGMYWTWQSGYINFKLEGNSNLCNTRNNEFQFHLGGYQSPFSSLQTLELNIENKNININVDVKKFLSAANIATVNQIMSPGSDAVKLSQIAATIFSIKK